MKDWRNSSIGELVDQNHARAEVLFYFGIHFLNYSDKTLEQACREKGLSPSQVIRALETPDTEGLPSLTSCPLDLMIEYLRHTHHQFVKRQLPYLRELIRDVKPADARSEGILHDLKLAFPLFVQDFIQHIYEEEDSLFHYISLLLKAANGRPFRMAELYYAMEQYSIQHFAIDHRTMDDEMAGIRSITDNYVPPHGAGLGLRILFRQLQTFEEKLKTHARVEDELLLPKALTLEHEARKILGERIRLN
jgi:regulator of cell morphogenesis and NO signaling